MLPAVRLMTMIFTVQVVSALVGKGTLFTRKDNGSADVRANKDCLSRKSGARRSQSQGTPSSAPVNTLPNSRGSTFGPIKIISKPKMKSAVNALRRLKVGMRAPSTLPIGRVRSARSVDLAFHRYSAPSNPTTLCLHHGYGTN